MTRHLWHRLGTLHGYPPCAPSREHFFLIFDAREHHRIDRILHPNPDVWLCEKVSRPSFTLAVHTTDIKLPIQRPTVHRHRMRKLRSCFYRATFGITHKRPVIDLLGMHLTQKLTPGVRSQGPRPVRKGTISSTNPNFLIMRASAKRKYCHLSEPCPTSLSSLTIDFSIIAL